MGLMKKLTSGLVAASLVFGLVGSAFADMSDANAVKAAADRMVTLKVVDGMPGGDLQLGANLTRAQVVKIIVTAFGKKDTAALLADAPSFADVKGHWAAGYIALAKAIATQNGFTLGYTDGTFKPEGNITFAEVLALIEKFMAIQPTAGLSYPNNVIDAAVNAGIIDAKDKATLTAFPNQAINRGQAFFLADNAFSKVAIDGTKTVYQKYDSATLPTVTVDSYNATTTAKEVTLSGKVANATKLTVNGNAVAFAADGTWTAKVTLDKVGDNTIAIEATDLVGNKAMPATAVKITRGVGAAASIDASLSADTVTAGGTASLTVKVLDANGEATTDTYKVDVPATLGTYDAATGTFTAAKAPATGNITITAGAATKTLAVTVTAGALDHVVADKVSAAPGEKVTLTAVDAAGNTITGVTWSQSSANALLDGTQGVFIASSAGNYTVTATVGGVSKTFTVGVYDNSAVAKYAVTVDKTNLVANNATTATVTVKAVDANGNVIGDNSDTVTLSGYAFEKKLSTDADTAFNGADLATLTLTNGVGTAVVRSLVGLVGGQTATLTANKTSATTTATMGSASVTLDQQVATSLKVSHSGAYLASDNTGNLKNFTVNVLDQAGEAMQVGYFPISWTASGPLSGSTSGSVFYSGGATAPSFPISPAYNVNGTATVTVTADGFSAATDSVTVQVPTAAAKFSITGSSNNPATATANNQTTLNYTVQVTDAAGVPVDPTTEPTVRVTFAVTDTQAPNVYVSSAQAVNTAIQTAYGPLSASAKYVDITTVGGTASFSVQAKKFAGVLSFTAADKAASGLSYASGAINQTFQSDVASGIQLLVGGATAQNSLFNLPGNTTSLPVKAQLVDASGNPVAKAGVAVTVSAAAYGNTGSRNSDISVANASSLKTDASGAVSTNVSLFNYVGYEYSLQAQFATSSTANAYSQQTVLNIANSVPASIQVSLYQDAARTIPLGQISAYQNVYATVYVKDQAGRLVDENLTTSVLTSSATVGNLPASLLTTGTEHKGTGWYDFQFNPATAPVTQIQFSSSNVPVAITGVASVAVRGSSAVGGIALAGGASQSIVSGQSTAYTLQLTDAYGNVIPNPSSSPITVNLTVSSIAYNATSGSYYRVQLRTDANGFSVTNQTNGSATGSVQVKAGYTSVPLYVVTDAPAGTSFTLDANDGNGHTLSTVTFTVK